MESSNVFVIILFWSCFLNAGSLTPTEQTVTTDETFEQELTTGETFEQELTTDETFEQELTTDETFEQELTTDEYENDYEYEMPNESNETDEYEIDYEYEMPNESNETDEFNEWYDWNEKVQLNSPYFGCLHSCCNSSQVLCKCDELCSYYGDCCYDSEHKESLERKGNLECRTLATAFDNSRYFTVATCPVNWTESSDIQERCVAEQSYDRDPLFTVPVSNLETGLVYKNRFCAICNGDEERVMEWSITARCFIYHNSNVSAVSPEFIIENLVYDEPKNSLGFWMDSNGEKTFTYCKIKFIIPEVVGQKLRGCLQMKSECAESFRNSELERLCEEHLDPVTVRNVGMYRNVYCALCNWERQNDYDCNYRLMLSAGPYPFNAVVDLNYQPVENDAKVKGRCEANEKYDPLFKKCRKLRGTK